ncbi:MAG: hypothetical protein RL300_671 [Pseudomonadota bacterium]
MKKFIRLIAVACLAAFIAACGGGGSDGPPPPVTSTEIFQVRTAYVNYFNDSRSLPFTISGTFSGVSISGNGVLTQSSVTNGTFEGAPVLQKVNTVTATVVANGSSAPLAVSSTSYADSNYVPKGSSNGEYRVVMSAVNIPVTAMVNDTGIWFNENVYSASDKASLLGTSSTSFVMLPDTASTAILKIIQTDKDTFGGVVMISTITFKMTPSGGLTRLSESSVGNGMTLTFTY